MSPFLVSINTLYSFRSLAKPLLIFKKKKTKKILKNEPPGGESSLSTFLFSEQLLLQITHTPQVQSFSASYPSYLSDNICDELCLCSEEPRLMFKAALCEAESSFHEVNSVKATAFALPDMLSWHFSSPMIGRQRRRVQLSALHFFSLKLTAS